MFLQLHDLRYNNVQDRITLRRVIFFVWKIFPNVSTLDRKREKGEKRRRRRGGEEGRKKEKGEKNFSTKIARSAHRPRSEQAFASNEN